MYSIGNASIFQPLFSGIPGMCFLPFKQSEPFLQAIASGQADFSLCTPTLNECVTTAFAFEPVAGMIGPNSSTSIAGDVIVRAGSSYQTYNDLRGTRLICGPFYVTAVFQLQAAALNATDFFSLFDVIAIETNQTVVLQALAQGDFDVAFFRSDQIASSFSGDFGASFRILNAHLDTPARFISSTKQYPQWQLTSSQTVSPQDRLSVFSNLTQLNSSDPRLVTAQINGFGLPYAYVSYYTLLQQLSLIDPNGTCRVTTDQSAYAYVTCPAGTVKVGAAVNQRNCQDFTVQCKGRQCFCNPCYKPVTTLVGNVGPQIFWPAVVSAIAVFWATCWALQVFQTGSSMVPRVPSEKISFTDDRLPHGTTAAGEVNSARLGTPPNHEWVTAVPIIAGKAPPGWSLRAFWQRAADACRLDHPNVLKALGVMTRHDVVLLIHAHFSYTVAQWIRAKSPHTIQLVMIAKELACGLQRLHDDEATILHKIAMENTAISESGHAQLIITWPTAAPSHSKADDVSALGVVLGQMLKQSEGNSELFRQMRHPVASERPTVMFVLAQLTAWEQSLLTSQASILNSILPPFASEALGRGDDVELRSHDRVAILFCDIVGFTSICDSISPKAVGDMLNRLYLLFDNLAIKYAIHKQEIVGDCWVGATNLLIDQANDFAARLATFALELITAAARTPVQTGQPHETLKVRIGIHVGPVVAGIVGSTLNPKFTILGSTINITQRMESTSAANRIHLSEPAANTIARQSAGLAACIVKRDQVLDIKGIGPMQTFWLT